MPLTSLNLFGCRQLSDLSPLAEMPLTSLDVGGTQVADLSPLRGMKPTTLNCYQTQVSDLSPLAGMPLTSLNLLECPNLHDLAPLARMNLSEISLTPKYFTKDKLEVIRRCITTASKIITNQSLAAY
jgi:Leucine-rich repeat (LRR) protein